VPLREAPLPKSATKPKEPASKASRIFYTVNVEGKLDFLEKMG
jgi:hypothetical protein